MHSKWQERKNKNLTSMFLVFCFLSCSLSFYLTIVSIKWNRWQQKSETSFIIVSPFEIKISIFIELQQFRFEKRFVITQNST